MYMYVCVCMCVCVCMYVCMYVCMHVYMYVYMFACTCVCMYIICLYHPAICNIKDVIVVNTVHKKVETFLGYIIQSREEVSFQLLRW